MHQLPASQHHLLLHMLLSGGEKEMKRCNLHKQKFNSFTSIRVTMKGERSMLAQMNML